MQSKDLRMVIPLLCNFLNISADLKKTGVMHWQENQIVKKISCLLKFRIFPYALKYLSQDDSADADVFSALNKAL